MVLSSVDFTQFLAEGSGIPWDVTFQVLGESPSCTPLGCVSAHGFVLSSVSLVFRNQIFGPLKTAQGSRTINVFKTSLGAVTNFVKIIYGDYSGLNKDILEMFEILDLADFYIIDEVKSKVISAIQSSLSLENSSAVLESAATFGHNSEVTADLMVACGQFLENQGVKVESFLTEQGVREELVTQVMSTMCQNCRHFSCKDGLYAVFPQDTPLQPGTVVEKWVRLEDWATDIYTCRVTKVTTSGPTDPLLLPWAQVPEALLHLELLHPLTRRRHGVTVPSPSTVNSPNSLQWPLMKFPSNETSNHWYSSEMKEKIFLGTAACFYRCRKV